MKKSRINKPAKGIARAKKANKRKEALKRMENYMYWNSKAARYITQLNAGYKVVTIPHEPSTKKNWDKRRLKEISYLKDYIKKYPNGKKLK